jgi:ABC-type uncharacterized transport system involved in gliding motility auxiliary subunit
MIFRALFASNPSPAARRRNSVAGLGLAAVLFVALNVLAQNTLTGARLDLTKDRLFTLSAGTRAVLSKIDEPVTLRYFFSENLGREIPGYANYARRVQDMLAEFAATAGGRLVVERFNPLPFSDVEDRAVALGLQGVPIDQGGEPVYFGIAGTNTTDDRETIAFLTPERERFLEYDLARMVQALANPKRRVVGVITDLPLDGDVMMMMRGMPTQPWMVMEVLRGQFEIRTLSADIDKVPDDVDVLMLAHAATITEKAQYAVDQFVLKGGRALVFVDPYAESQSGRQQMGASTSSDLTKLLQAWGVEMAKDKVVGDRASARRVNAGTAARVVPADYPVWMILRQANLNQDDPLMSQIAQINLASAGILTKREGATTTLEPLITTSPQSMAIDTKRLSEGAGGMPDILGIIKDYKPELKGMMIAARVTGPAQTAFPDGPRAPQASDQKPDDSSKPAETKPTEPKSAEAKPPAGHIAKSEKPISVIVVADSDLLDDRFWVQVQDFFGQRLAVPTANNADFVANALDFLAGGGELVGLRGRGTAQRPFELVRALQREAENRLRGTERQLQEKLNEVKKNLREAEGGDKTGGQAALTPQQQQAIEKFRAEMLDIRRQLRDVQADLRRDIDRLEAGLRFVNIGLVPVLVALIAAAVGGWRVVRRRRAVAHG